MESSEIWFLEGLNLFDRFCPVRQSGTLDKEVPSAYAKGDHIYFVDTPARHIYLIKHGRVRIGHYTSEGGEVTRAILREGEVFGEMVMAGEAFRKDFARSEATGTEVCMIDWTTMQWMMKYDASLSLSVVKWMGLRQQKLERRIELLTFKDARTRVVEFLKDAVKFKGQQIGHEWMIKTSLTHGDIATLTASSRQTVSEIMNDLRRENQIYFERGKIIFRDIDNLR